MCEEKLKKFNLKKRGIFWGGNQNAADGGIDVRCEYEGDVYPNSFIPRNKVGFQVKLYDLKANQIINEMQDKGVLREFIQDLCKYNGAYILVCGRSSVSVKMYQNRINAMKKAVQGYEGSENVCLDFFDSNRIATWVRDYPALIIWVREKTSRPLEGWKTYGKWSDTQQKDYTGYIIDEEKRLYDYMEDKEITVLEGIQKFRYLINKGAAIIRLTGLSGVGKTRLLEALFDENVGANALDPSKVIYADAAETLLPCAEQMVRELILRNEEVIVILDNCSAELHSVLMNICKTRETRKVSFITVEYDVQEQNTEETETFVLRPASDTTIEELIIKNYEDIPIPTMKRIVEISGGNARLALLFAKSLIKYNKNVNTMSNSELFKRLFWQRGQEDKELRKTAEVFSLLYSVDYEDEGADGELRKLCELAEITLKQARFYLEELQKRGLLQTRGKWCAVLPHALSNYLAINAIQCYRENIVIEAVIENGTERMKTSFAHRLTFLGCNDIVIKISDQWLDKEFFDLISLQPWQMECFYYLAQVIPHKALEFIKQAWSNLPDNSYQKHKSKLIISALAYYPEYFIECMRLLGEEKTKILDIGQYFQYTIFMNPECADKRYELIDLWLKEGKEELALGCLMKTLECGWNTGSGYNEFYFLNRSLKKNQEEDREYWFNMFSGCIKELIMADRFDQIILLSDFANKVFRLINWGFAGAAVSIAVEIRKKIFWKEGYIAIQRKLYYENKYSGDTVEKMRNLAELLKPQNVEEEIIYWCTSNTLDVYYRSGENVEEIFERHERKVKHYAKMLASDFSLFQRVLNELVMSGNYLLFSLGRELAAASFHDQIWAEICEIMQKSGHVNKGTDILRGLISEEKNYDQVKKKLGILAQNVNLLPTYISVVFYSDFFVEEYDRFLEIVQSRKVDIEHFQILAYCNNFLNLSLKDFLCCINSLLVYENPDTIIWLLCANKLHYEKQKAGNIEESIKKEILLFLVKSKISMYDRINGNLGDITNYNIKTVIALSCDSMVNENLQYISLFYYWLQEDTQENYNSLDVYEIFDELYRMQPELFLETFIERISNIARIIGDDYNIRKCPLLQDNLESLVSWCNVKPDERYDKIFRCTYGYEWADKKYQWRSIVPLAMSRVRDRKGLALKLMKRIEPTYTNTSWSAERALREDLFDLFERDADDEIAELAKKQRKEYREITEQFRKIDMEHERGMQRFE